MLTNMREYKRAQAEAKRLRRLAYKAEAKARDAEAIADRAWRRVLTPAACLP